MNHGADIDRVRDVTRDLNVDIFVAKPEESYSSMNHGTCLDIIFERMDSEYGMIIDCDVAFLKEGWDVVMVKALDDENVIIGAEYDGDKYLNFPNVICAMFKTRVLKDLGISFKPESSHRGMGLLTGEALKVYGWDRVPGREKAAAIILDTGSELPRKIKDAGLSGIPMQLFRAPEDENQKLFPVHAFGGVVLAPARVEFMVPGLRGEEYQYQGEVYCTHLGRSYTREFGVDPFAVAWEKRVREWLE